MRSLGERLIIITTDEAISFNQRKGIIQTVVYLSNTFYSLKYNVWYLQYVAVIAAL